MFDFLTKMIPVSTGLNMMKQGIEEKLGESINGFKMFYIDAQDELIFEVLSPKHGLIKQPYTGNNKGLLLFAIRNLAKMWLKGGETLDIVGMKYNEDETVNLDVFVTLDGKKIKHEITNYKPE